MAFPKVAPALPVRIGALEIHINRSFDEGKIAITFAAHVIRSDNTTAIVQDNLAKYVEQEQLRFLADFTTLLQQEMVSDMIGEQVFQPASHLTSQKE